MLEKEGIPENNPDYIKYYRTNEPILSDIRKTWREIFPYLFKFANMGIPITVY